MSGRGSAPDWWLIGALSLTQVVWWGVIYYGFAIFLLPMQEDLGFSRSRLAAALSLALMVSALSGPMVGRHLDGHSPRRLMTIGSAAGVVLVIAWSRLHSLHSLYLVWLGLGVVMAAVLYEPAVTVVTKYAQHPRQRRQAVTCLTLVAGLGSFIFAPLSHALIAAYGWRSALLILAGILAVVTVPLHAFTLPVDPPTRAGSEDRGGSLPAGTVLRSSTFWLLVGAFGLAALTATAVIVQMIPLLLERSYSAGFGARCVALVGLAQISGRLLLGVVGERLPAVARTSAPVLLVSAGTAVLAVAGRWTPLLVLSLVALGAGTGMATLARATLFADLYGVQHYGAIASVAGSVVALVRSAGPLAAAALAGATSHTAMLWVLCGLTAVAGVAVLADERVRYRGVP